MGNERDQVRREVGRATNVITRELQRVDAMAETTELERGRKLRHVRELLLQTMIYADGVTSMILLEAGGSVSQGPIDRLADVRELDETRPRSGSVVLGRVPR